MTKPIVALPADVKHAEGYDWHASPRQYVDAALKAADVVPLIVPAFGLEEDAAEAIASVLDRVDGVLVTGARSNVCPELYGEQATEANGPYDRERDATSIPLIRGAIERGVSLFAICRGIQELTVALGGSRLLSTFVQQREFYTAQNVAVLTPLDPEMSLKDRLFYAMCIKHNDFRYSAFGREANRTLAELEMPEAKPSWVEEAEIPDLDDLRGRSQEGVSLGQPEEWKEFVVDKLFVVKRGKYVPKAQKRPGQTPSVSSTVLNNGVSDFIDHEPIFPGRVVAVARNGSVGHATYQPEPFFATDDVHVWKARDRELTPGQGLFLCTIIRRESYRYSYGRKWTVAGMRKALLRLPATHDGDPDWTFMESFVMGLPFSTYLE